MTRRQLLAGMLAAPLQGSRPNILWIMSDEHRPDSLGCYGTEWAHSPNLDRLARGGVLFESAYVPSPVCVPCRSSLLTGNTPSTTGVLHNQAELKPGTRMLTWDFEDAGYQTASFGKKHYFLKGPKQAFQTEGGSATDEVVDAQRYGKGRRPEDYDAVQYRADAGQKEKRQWILAGKFPEDESRTAEAQNIALAQQWLEKRDASKPFLLRLSLNAPHTPVVVPEKYLKLIDPAKIRVPGESVDKARPKRESEHLQGFEGSQNLSAEEIRKLRHYYYARVAFLDSVVGGMLKWMGERGLLRNTIIAFVADHGTHLGDHGLLQKQTFYEQVATVPFLFSGRGVKTGVRVKTPVNAGSLLPTLTEMAGLRGFRAEYPSLAPVLRSGREPRERPVFSEIAYGYQGYRDTDRQVMVRLGQWKLSVFPDSGEPDGALYDLVNDPGEMQNLFGKEQYRDIRKQLAKLLQ